MNGRGRLAVSSLTPLLLHWRLVPLRAPFLACLVAFLLVPAVLAEHLGPQDRDCRDFRTWSEAQAFFAAAGDNDPHHLDTDGDGVACETLPGAPGREPTARPATGVTSTSRPRSPTGTRRPPATPLATRTPGAERAVPTPPAATPGGAALPPDLPVASPAASSPLPAPPETPVIPGNPPAVLPAPTRLYARAQEPVGVYAADGERFGSAVAGAAYPVCAVGEDGWIAVDLGASCLDPAWIEAGPAVQLAEE